MYVYREYECKGKRGKPCGFEWEDFVDKKDLLSKCPQCGKKNDKPVLSAPNISALSAMSPEFFKEKMMQRSSDHTKKLVQANSDDPKYKGQGKELSRQGQIRSK